MAKQRKTNSIADAISAVTAAIAIESVPNPTDAQKQQIHEAKQHAAAVIEDSNFTHLADNADNAIEAQIQAEEDAEAAEIEKEIAALMAREAAEAEAAEAAEEQDEEGVGPPDMT